MDPSSVLESDNANAKGPNTSSVLRSVLSHSAMQEGSKYNLYWQLVNDRKVVNNIRIIDTHDMSNVPNSEVVFTCESKDDTDDIPRVPRIHMYLPSCPETKPCDPANLMIMLGSTFLIYVTNAYNGEPEGLAARLQTLQDETHDTVSLITGIDKKVLEYVVAMAEANFTPYPYDFHPINSGREQEEEKRLHRVYKESLQNWRKSSELETDDDNENDADSFESPPPLSNLRVTGPLPGFDKNDEDEEIPPLPFLDDEDALAVAVAVASEIWNREKET